MQISFIGTYGVSLSTLQTPQIVSTSNSIHSSILCNKHGHFLTLSPTAYSGRFCEDDVDGCAGMPCFEGVECTDVEAPGVGAMCDGCPEGYIEMEEKCIGTRGSDSVHDIVYHLPLMCISKDVLIRKISLS